MVLTTGSVSRSEMTTVLADGRRRGHLRLLVIGSLGVHPDAASSRLRELWTLEEACRASGMPVMVLRLAPLLGPASPLWRRLRTRPALGRHADVLVSPLAESDAVLAVRRATELEWMPRPEWYEVAGAQVWSLAELVDLAHGAGERLPAGSGEWEPALDEMAEARIPDGAPWRLRSSLDPAPIGALAATWP